MPARSASTASDIFTATSALSDDLVAAYTGTRADGSLNEGDAALSGALVYPVDVSANLGRRYEVTYVDDGVNPAGWNIYEYRAGVSDKIPVALGVSALNDPAVVAATGLDLSVANGAPADGDRFEVFASSPNMFDNIGMFVDALERPGPSGMADGAVAVALQDIDAGIENILKVRAQIGSQLNETKSLTSVGSDLNLQYSEVISELMDVDYVEALSRLTQQTTYLQAAQQSFMRVASLSLFDYLG